MLFSLEDVSFCYPGRPLFSHLSFTHAEGAFTVLIGPNGGGKSTLLKLLLGFLMPQEGLIQVLGAPPGSRQTIGYVPQEIIKGMTLPITVQSVVLMGRLTAGNRYWNKADKFATDEALYQMELSDLKNRKFRELSTGQRQRVLIARALVSHPQLLLLDEPLASVDHSAREQILEALKQASQICSVLMVSHDLAVIPKSATKVILVNEGLHDLQNQDWSPEALSRLQAEYSCGHQKGRGCYD